jgi:hypothetical protein
VIQVTVNQFGQLQQTISSHFGPAIAIFGSYINYAEVDNVIWFSQLKERNAANEIINFLKEEFPFVLDLEVLAPAGANGLYATLSDGSRRRLSAVSAGINKIVTILLATAFIREGIILIDEIENGIFYEKYSAVWRILYRFALDTKNQIFVTSHSDECLRALPDVIGDNINDFCLLRAEYEAGKSVVRHISGASMKAALNRDVEIRGATIGAEVGAHY